MKKIKKVLATAMVGALAFSVVGCKMIERTPESIQKTVLAKVGDENITRGDIDKELKPYLEQFAAQYGEDFEEIPELKEQLKMQREQILEALVDEKLLVQKAYELNLVPEEAELEAEIQTRIEEMKTAYGTEENFKKALDSYGYTDETFKEFMKNQVVSQKAVEYMHKDIAATDDEIKEYYEKNKESFGGANVAHILIEDEAKAKEIRERAANGEDFATLAKEFSEDPGSKDKGGDYGFIPYNSTQYVQEFVDGFKNLGEGEISQPVKSDYGYHVIKATGVGTKSLEESKEQIKTTIENEEKNTVYEETMTKWREEANVKTYADKL